MSTRKLLLLLVAAVTFMASPLSAICATGSFKINGTGIYRSNEKECLKSLPAFARKLNSLGLKLSKPLECEEVLGEVEAYAPSFEAFAPKELMAETAVPGYYPNLASCVSSLKALIPVVADEDEIVVESGCVEVHVAEAENEDTTRQFQPMVFLLKQTGLKFSRESTVSSL